MKPLAVILALAISGIALSSDFTPASASKMNGKCCAPSDGGRSYRYRAAVWRAANPHPRSCSGYAAPCIHWSNERAYSLQACLAAKAQCMRTGVYVGPYSSWEFSGMQRK
jgi:hypothetical protein